MRDIEIDFRAYDRKNKMFTNFAICDGSLRCMDKHTGVWLQDPERFELTQFTGLRDENGKRIFEGDIVQYLTYDGFDCKSIVKFGKYKQDGSSGEYKARNCLGFYVEVGDFTCPNWCKTAPEHFPDYLNQQNLVEVSSECKVIGNIYDNPELLKGGKP